MNIYLIFLLLMLTLNFHSIVKEIFKNSKGYMLTNILLNLKT